MCFKEKITTRYILLAQIMLSNRGEMSDFLFHFKRIKFHFKGFLIATSVADPGNQREAKWLCQDPGVTGWARCTTPAQWSDITVTRTESSLDPESESVWRTDRGLVPFQYAVGFSDLFSLYENFILQNSPCPTTNLHCSQTQIQFLDPNWLLMEVGTK